MAKSAVQPDPLGSPYPIPWSWVWEIQAKASTVKATQVSTYRSHALVSPNEHYAAYSRIQIQADPDFTHSRVSSILFIEDLKTRDLQTIVPRSPFSDCSDSPIALAEAAPVVMLVPISWSENHDRVLARTFEAVLGSSFASDSALIWESASNRVQALVPKTILYTHALLLGWSRQYPNQALFRAGMLGESDWPQWRVEPSGRTQAAVNDQAQIFGQVTRYWWSGAQR